MAGRVFLTDSRQACWSTRNSQCNFVGAGEGDGGSVGIVWSWKQVFWKVLCCQVIFVNICPRPDSLGRDPDVWEYTSCCLAQLVQN